MGVCVTIEIVAGDRNLGILRNSLGVKMVRMDEIIQAIEKWWRHKTESGGYNLRVIT